jgi:hypothetical protein
MAEPPRGTPNGAAGAVGKWDGSRRFGPDNARQQNQNDGLFIKDTVI